jgi:dihydrofolate reductase
VSEPLPHRPHDPLAMIAALTPSFVIGKDGGIPWRYPEDSKHFKAVTMGHALIMGRATYDSIGKPLPGRRNIVVSRQPELRIPGVEVTSSLAQAIELARQTDHEPMIGGGGALYAEALPLATRLYLTYLDEEHEGNVYFPRFDDADWRVFQRVRSEKHPLTYVTLDRVR